MPSGSAYYINGVLLSIDNITTEDLILKADFANEDWGDVSVASNSVTLDTDVVGAAELADEDWGDVSITSGVASVEDLSIASQDTGDIIYFNGTNWTRLAADAGKYLKSGTPPSWDTPAGAGNMATATYDADVDGDIDVAAGGTEKSTWTQYAIPYLSATTTFGEIAIGDTGDVLTVVDGTSYGWVPLPVDTVLSAEEVQDYVGGMITSNTETGITVTYEDGDGTLDFAVTPINYVEHFLDVKASDADYCHAQMTGSGSPQTITTDITSPDVPRNIIVTFGAGEGSGNITVKGTLANGTTAQSENFAFAASTPVIGAMAFATVTEIDIPNSMSGVTVDVGLDNLLGLANSFDADADVYKKHCDGIDIAIADAQIEPANGTLDCGTIAPNSDYTFWYHP
ncbi:MAG: hypothetical protein MUP69_10295 [Candidatus Atribacteria bacterium]|nr:hypothetical protein [Candidatus Atribacteria bacterium]